MSDIITQEADNHGLPRDSVNESSVSNENDFIELSDILSKEDIPTLPPDYFEDIEDDVIIGENVDIDVSDTPAPVVNNDLNGYGSQDNVSNVVLDDNINTNDGGKTNFDCGEDVVSTSASIKTPRKRGRQKSVHNNKTATPVNSVKKRTRKTKQVDNTNNLPGIDNSSEQVNIVLASENPTERPKRITRSRKTDNNNQNISKNTYEGNSMLVDENVSQKETTNKVSTSNESGIVDTFRDATIPGTLRTKRDLENENNTMSDILSKPAKQRKKQNLNDSVVIENSKSKKRGRKTRRGKRKSSHKMVIDKVQAGLDFQDELFSKPHNPDVAENNDTSDGDDISLSKYREITSKNVQNICELTHDKPKVVVEHINIESQLKCREIGPDILLETEEKSNVESQLEIEKQLNVETQLETGHIEGYLSAEKHTYNEDSNLLLEIKDQSNKRNSKKHLMADFEYNVDGLSEIVPDEDKELDLVPLISEDGRPLRRKARQKHYDENSDEDPYANIELSDSDSGAKFKKGHKYYSDYEYVPGDKKASSESTAMDDDDITEDRPKRKRFRKRSEIGSSRTSRKVFASKNNSKAANTITAEVTTITADSTIDDDIENCLQSSVIKIKSQDHGNESSSGLQNILSSRMIGSELKIKKITPEDTAAAIIPLDIPVIDQNACKKMINTSSQTNNVLTMSSSVQTDSSLPLKVKRNTALTNIQSENACVFLKNILTTTSDLGQLMCQKSNEFIEKKINTNHVKDTTRIDYCIKKASLLFKLAKDNLTSMEDTLGKQYDEFISANNLTSSFETDKKISPKVVVPPPNHSSDSDCEIVEEPVQVEKPKFNAKTLSINKELTIKIAKKPTAESTTQKQNKQKLDNVGTHSVWISDSIMVKKVKPQQSFLAQDGRCKKPPDYISEEDVKYFFDNYYRKQAICAPYTSVEWLDFNHNIETICNYFIVEKPLVTNSSSGDLRGPCSEDDAFVENTTNNGNVANEFNQNCNFVGPFNISDEQVENNRISTPRSLLALCTESLNKYFKKEKHSNEQNKCTDFIYNTELEMVENPKSLLQICLYSIVKHTTESKYKPEEKFLEKTISPYVLSLKALSYERVLHLFTMNMQNSEPIQEASINTITYNQISYYENPEELNCDQHLNVKSLSSLCLNKIQCVMSNSFKKYNFQKSSLENPEELNCDQHLNVKSLSSLCLEKIQSIMNNSCKKYNLQKSSLENDEELNCDQHLHVKSLSSLCLEKIQCVMNNSCKKYNLQKSSLDGINTNISEQLCPSKQNEVKRLFNICFDVILKCMYGQNERITSSNVPSLENINFVTLDVFLDTDNNDFDSNENEIAYTDDDLNNYDEFDGSYNDYEPAEVVDEDWNAQIELRELKPCFEPVIQSVHTEITADKRNDNTEAENDPIVQVKMEPDAEFSMGNDINSVVKHEPEDYGNEIVNIPDNFITKREMINNIELGSHENNNQHSTQNCSSPVNIDSFDEFLRNNVEARSVIVGSNGPILSKNNLRMRKQYEPDSDDEIPNDNVMSLLIPHSSAPVPSNYEKGSLMESSTDDDLKQGPKKSQDPLGKRKKRRTRRNVSEIQENKKESSTTHKDKTPSKQIESLTRRMRGRIRNDLNINESTDSENDIPVLKSKSKTEDKDKTMKNKAKNEIQCNSVDSTQNENAINKSKTNDTDRSNGSPTFTGFSDVDQSQTSIYQKYVKCVLTKLIPENKKQENINTLDENQDVSERSDTPLFAEDEPVEQLECEPSLPMFEHNKKFKPVKGRKKKVDTDKLNVTKVEFKNYVIRDSWHCYPINSDDIKLYSSSYIKLNKLPESFVEMYYKYIQLEDKDKNDTEIDRLTNLRSLQRSTNVKEKLGVKVKDKEKQVNSINDESGSDTMSASSPMNTDNFNELSLSEDEIKVEEGQSAPLVSKQTPENSLAKNLLMGDHDSDAEARDEVNTNNSELGIAKSSKSKKHLVKKEVNSHPETFVLTADKMMKKELEMLHAPVILDDEKEKKEFKVTPMKLKLTKSKRSTDTREQNKMSGDDSSSEEEKMWVNTKEKLLKRMEKKTQENTSVDDAKRSKLVTEFIEKRGDNCSRGKHVKGRSGRSRRSRLEREKQLRVLTHELLGTTDSSNTYILPGKKKAQQSYAKGRRNIRKVLDKKSLARSTVIANMEEFERKRRMNMTQNRLRELLDYEEGVNAVVINDELCLEYDFDELQPVVTVHPFFTKVMKAHQCEGVKFLWDACFESLQYIESGHQGGGCILAHCMGLGKTLQVLALLQTVLTHPRVGMRRVLVCCPLSTVLNWVDEIHKWLAPVTDQIKVFELSKLKKTYERAYQLEDWYNGGGIFIVGYELFRSLSTLDSILDNIRPTVINKIRTALLDPGPDIIVCDEGHLLKNDCSVLAVAMSRVRTKRRIVLTGTPMQNNLREYYCMVNFVKPNLLGTYSEYSNRFENPIMNGQHRDSSEADIRLMKARTHILHKVLEGCLQRQEASVLYPYLPRKHEYTVFIALTKCQSDLYRHYLTNFAMLSKQNILKDFHVLQKIWSHPRVLHNFLSKYRNEDAMHTLKDDKLEDDLAREDLASEDVKPGAGELWWLEHMDRADMLETLESSNKFLTVFKILDECVQLNDKVLLFSTSLFTMDALEYFLKKINKWSLGQEYYRLDGSVPAEVRQKWCREFNAEHNHKTKLFLISTRAGSLGLNMTAANRVILFDTSWNPAHDIQSIFRVYRFGQKKDCYIYRLVAMGTMEQKIYERSVTKQAVACRVVDEQQIDRHYNMAELSELYRFDELGEGVAGGVALGVCDVALLRVARDTPALHAVHEHDSLLRDTCEQQLPEHERAAAWDQFQQEQAHKQMEGNYSEIGKKIPLKRMLSIDQSKKPSQGSSAGVNNYIKPDSPLPDKCDPEYLPYMEPKSKRSRKSNVAQSNDTTNQTNTVAHLQNYNESAKNDMLITKIADILVKHNFHTVHGAKSVSDLAKGVTHLLADSEGSGRKKRKNNESELMESIAKVLKQYETMPYVKPEETQIAEEPIESVPSTSKAPIQTKTKRKAAESAGKYIEQLKDNPDQAVIDDDDSDFDVNFYNVNVEPEPGPSLRNLLEKPVVPPKTPFIPPHITIQPSPLENKPPNLLTIQPSPLENKPPNLYPHSKNIRAKNFANITKFNAPTSDAKNIKPMPMSHKPTEIITTSAPKLESVVVLSDDDDESVIPDKVDTKTKKITVPINKPKPVNVVVDKPQMTITQKTNTEDEPVPLHSALLTNTNFVKIVAHTFQKRNPDLDDQSAVLAAEYSIKKTLEDITVHNKTITSGKVYDIALQMVGKSILKALWESAPNVAAKTPEVPSAVTPSSVVARAQESKTAAMPMVVIPEPSPAPVQQMPIVVPGPSTVVPVKLIRRVDPCANFPNAKIEECILPDDDDDVRITSSPGPPQDHQFYPPEPSVPPATQPLDYQTIRINEPVQPPVNNEQTQSPQKLSVIDMLNKAKLRRLHMIPKSAVPQNAPLEIVLEPTLGNNTVVINTTIPKATVEGTICLDSDDEERAPAIVPSTNTQTTNPTMFNIAGIQNPSVMSAIQNIIKLNKAQNIIVVPASALTNPPAAAMATVEIPGPTTNIPAPKSRPPTRKPKAPAQQGKKVSQKPPETTQNLPPTILSNTSSANNQNTGPGDTSKAKTGDSILIATHKKTDLTSPLNTPAFQPNAARKISSNEKPSQSNTKAVLCTEILDSDDENVMSDNSSRSPSPSNPLDIFKNVVHIQADTYSSTPEKTAPIIKTTNNSTSAQKTSSSTSAQKTSSYFTKAGSNTTLSKFLGTSNSTSAPKTSSNTALSRFLGMTGSNSTSAPKTSSKTTLAPKTSSNITSAPKTSSKTTLAPKTSSKTILAPKTTTAVPKVNTMKLNTSSSVSLKLKSTDKKDKPQNNSQVEKTEKSLKTQNEKANKKVYKEGKFLGTVDLTEDLGKPLPRPSTSSKGDTISGTSSSIIINPGKQLAKGMLENKSDKTSEKPIIVHMESLKTPSGYKTLTLTKPVQKVDVAKHKTPTATESVAVKKRKLDVPMTLEDFTLDDLEDIIELE